MFNYIASILAQFSRTQRILALLLLLFSITVISIAPSFINAITTDKKEYQIKIDNQRKQINNQECLIDTLTIKIRANNRKCTDEQAAREAEFISMLDDLKNDLKPNRKALVLQSTTSSVYNSNDTIVMMTQSMPPPLIVNDNSEVINKIDNFKAKIKQ